MAARLALPTAALFERVRVRAALSALAKRLDTETAAGGTIRRRRAIFYDALEYAVESELLTANLLDRIKWSPPEQVAEEADPACVPNPAQVAKLLAAVRELSPRGRHLAASSGACTTPPRGRARPKGCSAGTAISPGAAGAP